MRILYAVHGYKPAYRLGGPIVSVSEAAETLVKKGHEVIVFATNSNLDEDLDVPLGQPNNVNGVEVWYFRKQAPLRAMLPFVKYVSKSVGFLYAPGMSKQLDSIVPTVDLVHTQIPFIYPTYVAARAAFKYSKPLFYHQRGAYDPERLKFRSLKKSLYLALCERSIMEQASTVIALTEAEHMNYRSIGVNTPCRIIPNGVDISKYRSQSTGASGVKWGIPEDALVVLFLGRLHPIKGADKLLEAFLRVTASFPNAILVLAGPDEFGLKDSFSRMVENTNSSNRVRFPGMLVGEEKIDMLARADLFCLPSSAEGFSIAVLESLASATPVLLSPGCHFPEVVSAAVGWVVEAEVDALAQGLTEALSDPGRLERYGSSARDLVAQKYTWNRIADELVGAYRDGIERFRLQCKS